MERFELVIGRFMLVSVLVCLVLVSLGGIYYLIQHGSDPVPIFIYPSKEALQFETLKDILIAAFMPLALGIVQLGLLALLMVQIFRVFLTAWLFIKLRDKLFACFSLVIFIVLIITTFSKF